MSTPLRRIAQRFDNELTFAKKLRTVLAPYSKSKKWNKLFCIGAHKTGTTSLERILHLLGYDLPDQTEIEISTFKQVMYGRYERLSQMVSQYDAFQDTPFALSNIYVALDALFPNSKFILTYREPDQWFNSLEQAHMRALRTEVRGISSEAMMEFPLHAKGHARDVLEWQYLYTSTEDTGLSIEPNWSLSYDPVHFKSHYRRRNTEIETYFAHRPNDLLTIDLTREHDISKIVKFLELPTFINFTIPHLNKTNSSQSTNDLVTLLDPELHKLVSESR